MVTSFDTADDLSRIPQALGSSDQSDETTKGSVNSECR